MAEDLAAKVARLESQMKELLDRQQITEVLYRYCRAVDRCDPALLESCYWPDGKDNHGLFGGSPKEFAEYVMRQLRRTVCTQHSITNPLIEFDGDRAFVECQWYVLHRLESRDGKVYVDNINEGRYLDVFESRRNEWRILHRHVVIDASRNVVDPRMKMLMEQMPENLLSSKKPLDPLYRGFGVAEIPLLPTINTLDDLWVLYEDWLSAKY